MKRYAKGIAYGALAAVSYGTNPLFALPMYSAGIDMNSILFYRYSIAVILYGLWLKLVKKMSFKISKKEFLPIFFLGLFFSMSSLTLFEAFKYIEAGVACTILFIYPVIVAIIMAMFFKEKLTKRVILSIVLILSGIFALYKGKAGMDLNLFGVSLVLFSALLYALYIIGVKNIKSIIGINSEIMSFYVMLSGLLVYIVNLKFCTQLHIIDKPILWLYTVALALLPTIISIETITISIKLIGSTRAAILGSLEPLTAIFFGVVVFHEQLTLRIILGIIAILLGVLLIILKKQPTKKEC